LSRRTYIYRPHPETGEMTAIEVSRDAPDADAQLGIRRSTGDGGKFQYDNLRSTDGVDISSRTKHREYLKATGLAMASDFKESGDQYRKAREAGFSNETKAYKEDLKRDIYTSIQQVRNRRRR
jgi:hypothetical protein